MERHLVHFRALARGDQYGIFEKSPSRIARLMFSSGCHTTLPAPIVRCPGSEAPCWPSGSPTALPEAFMMVFGISRSNVARVGIVASARAFPGPAGATPKPSMTIRQTETCAKGTTRCRLLLYYWEMELSSSPASGTATR